MLVFQKNKQITFANLASSSTFLKILQIKPYDRQKDIPTYTRRTCSVSRSKARFASLKTVCPDPHRLSRPSVNASASPSSRPSFPFSSCIFLRKRCFSADEHQPSLRFWLYRRVDLLPLLVLPWFRKLINIGRVLELKYMVQ